MPREGSTLYLARAFCSYRSISLTVMRCSLFPKAMSAIKLLFRTLLLSEGNNTFSPYSRRLIIIVVGINKKTYFWCLVVFKPTSTYDDDFCLICGRRR